MYGETQARWVFEDTEEHSYLLMFLVLFQLLLLLLFQVR
jgi:hypothetical protein